MLLLVRVLTEYMEPAEYGKLALGLTVAALINQVVMSGVTPGVSRFYSIAAEHLDLEGYFRGIRKLLIFATLIVGAVGLLMVAGLWYCGYPQTLDLMIASLVLAVFQGYNSSFCSVQTAARKRALVAFLNGTESWLRVLSVFAVARFIGISSTAIACGYVGTALLMTVTHLTFLRQNILASLSPNPKPSTWASQMAAYSLPFSCWGVFSWGQQVSDRWALEIFGATGEVGQYVILYQLGYTPIAIITGLATTFFGPILFQRSGDASDRSRNEEVHRLGWQLAYFALAITFISFAATMIFHGAFFSLLVAPEYRSVSYRLPWVVMAGGLNATSEMLSLKLMSEMKSTSLVTVKIGTSIVGIVLNLSGAALAGIDGVVASLMFFSILNLIWMSMLSRHIVHHKLAV